MYMYVCGLFRCSLTNHSFHLMLHLSLAQWSSDQCSIRYIWLLGSDWSRWRDGGSGRSACFVQCIFVGAHFASDQDFLPLCGLFVWLYCRDRQCPLKSAQKILRFCKKGTVSACGRTRIKFIWSNDIGNSVEIVLLAWFVLVRGCYMHTAVVLYHILYMLL